MDSAIKKSVIYGRVKGVNTSDSIYNITVELANKTIMNLKTDKKYDLKQGYIYEFDIAQNTNSERLVAFIMNLRSLIEIEDINVVDRVYREFDSSNPSDLKLLKDTIYNYINKIDNKILHDITLRLVEIHYDKFFIYPAATRMHHNYVGGLAYHTTGMLELADGFLKTYSYLNKDYLYSGIILHDLGKILEFTGVENTEYTLKGQLLGHLVMGSIFINDVAKELHVEDSEEVLILEHMVLSHHGLPQFGACKKPQTAEAEVLWYIDTLDSKLRVLGEVLENTETGAFTDTIGVLDKTKFYKHK